MFFAAVIARSTLGLSLMALWQILVLLQAITGFFALGPEPSMLFGIANIGFGMGMVLALVAPRMPSASGTPLLIIGIASYASIMGLEWKAGGPLDAAYRSWGMTTNTLLYLCAATAVVAGMVIRDLANQKDSLLAQKDKSSTKFWRMLGNSSYSLYLVHLPFGSIAVRILSPFVGGELLMIFLCIGAIAASVIVHVWIEKPVLRWLQVRHKRKHVAIA
jgi:exopolysaccharide production protein ExoZ